MSDSTSYGAAFETDGAPGAGPEAAANTITGGAPEWDPERVNAARKKGFFPLMLLLDRLLPSAAEAGAASTPQEDPFRFRHDPTMSFSPSEVVRVEQRTVPPDPSDWSSTEKKVVEIVTTFLGLTGTVSPLPQFICEEIAQEDEDAPVMREFLDLFHHRILSFFLRAKTKYDPPAVYRSDQGDAWSERLLALLGFDVAGQDPKQGIAGEPRWRLLRLAPFLAEPSITARALEVAIADVLSEVLPGAPVKVEQFVENWVDIGAADRTRLGIAATTLGESAVLGSRLFDRAGKVRVVVGPVDRSAFRLFSMRPHLVGEVHRLIRALSSGELEHELILELQPEAAEPARLLSQAVTRLGRNAWLGRQNQLARVKLDGAAAEPALL